MLSEYEQNLSKENDSDIIEEDDVNEDYDDTVGTKKSKKWHLSRQNSSSNTGLLALAPESLSLTHGAGARRNRKSKPHYFNKYNWRFNKNNNREITTIAEDSV